MLKKRQVNPEFNRAMNTLGSCCPGSILKILFCDDPTHSWFVKVEWVADLGDQFELGVFTHKDGTILHGRTILIAPRLGWFIYSIPVPDRWGILEHIHRRSVLSIQHLYCPAS